MLRFAHAFKRGEREKKRAATPKWRCDTAEQLWPSIFPRCRRQVPKIMFHNYRFDGGAKFMQLFNDH
jgi:hypothetical protein